MDFGLETIIDYLNIAVNQTTYIDIVQLCNSFLGIGVWTI